MSLNKSQNTDIMGLITLYIRDHLLKSPSKYQESFYFKSLSYNKYENLYITCSAEFLIYRTTHETAIAYTKKKKEEERRRRRRGGGEEEEEKKRRRRRTKMVA